jgi:hypothetical protein
MIQLGWIALILAAGPSSPSAGDAVVHLHVRPMPAPKPAMKYQLLPELGEVTPGNAAQDYLRCFAEQRIFFYSKKAVEDRARYRQMPLVELRLLKVTDFSGGPLRRADWAARMDTNDWQALTRVQEGSMEPLPPEMAPLQILAESLQVRFRVEVAEWRFDDAIRTAKTMLSLSRHVSEHPTEVADLLALGIAHLGFETLEEMVQQPRCPNLYWALTDLPSPLFDLHKGVQGERIRVAADLKPLRGDAPMAETEIESLVSRLSGVMSFARQQAGLSPRSLRLRLQAKAKDQAKLADARRRLVEAGSAAGLVDRFPPVQVILLDEKREYEVQRDERMKLLGLPVWQLDEINGGEDREAGGDGLLADLLPHIVKLRRTQGALEQQIALLRHVEALRLYAAGHDGKLPAKLSDIPVPLPDDPVTGKPFVYTVEGADAHLRGRSPRSDRQHARSDVHYVVTLLK